MDCWSRPAPASRPLGIPGSAGVPEEIAQLTLALPYNDLAQVEAAFATYPGAIAAVILERRGQCRLHSSVPGYLTGLRALTAREALAHRR